MPRGKHAPSISASSAAPLREIAYRKLQSLLHEGAIEIGAPLSEVALAARFGMSRTPVREAVGQLVAEGLLEQLPNRGTVLRRLTRRDVIELFETRRRSKFTPLVKPPGAASPPESRKNCSRS